MTINKALLLATALVLGMGSLGGCAEFKDAGRSIGHGTRDAAQSVGHGSKRVWNATMHGGETTE